MSKAVLLGFVVGSLGFEPRIANAPGWYTEPFYPAEPHSTLLEPQQAAIRRPQTPVRYQDQIIKTIDAAKVANKRPNTIHNFWNKLRQLGRVCDLMNPDDVKNAIGYSKLANSSKCSFSLAYEWYAKANRLQWQKPRFKWELGTP